MTGPGHLGDDAPRPPETGLGLRQEPVRGTWGGGGRCKGIQDTGGALWWARSPEFSRWPGLENEAPLCLACRCSPRDARCFPPPPHHLCALAGPSPDMLPELPRPSPPRALCCRPRVLALRSQLRTDPWAGSGRGHKGPLGSLQPGDAPVAACYLLPVVWLPGPEHPPPRPAALPLGWTSAGSSRGRAGLGLGAKDGSDLSWPSPTASGQLPVLPSPSPCSARPHRHCHPAFPVVPRPTLGLIRG